MRGGQSRSSVESQSKRLPHERAFAQQHDRLGRTQLHVRTELQRHGRTCLPRGGWSPAKRPLRVIDVHLEERAPLGHTAADARRDAKGSADTFSSKREARAGPDLTSTDQAKPEGDRVDSELAKELPHQEGPILVHVQVSGHRDRGIEEGHRYRAPDGELRPTGDSQCDRPLGGAEGCGEPGNGVPSASRLATKRRPDAVRSRATEERQSSLNLERNRHFKVSHTGREGGEVGERHRVESPRAREEAQEPHVLLREKGEACDEEETVDRPAAAAASTSSRLTPSTSAPKSS
jgi:hypothetical protein